MELLRFTTAGSIDDGKSTLTGRLLYDTGNIKEDVLESVSKVGNIINLAHITDGLRSERAGGITIDIGYRYFKTNNRKYIISDAPGHFQYTKNMVTGASNVDVMIILIDAKNGITSQTRLHSLVASFLRTRYVVVAVNKMDALAYGEDAFESIRNEYRSIAERLQLRDVIFIPISALHGDNVSAHSENMPWYHGPDLLSFLEQCDTHKTTNGPGRVSIQYCAEDESTKTSLYFGKVLSGEIHVNEPLKIFPPENEVLVKKIISGYEEVETAKAGENICLELNTNDGMKRGSILAPLTHRPQCTKLLTAAICWLDPEINCEQNKEFILRIHTQESICHIRDIEYRINPFSFDKEKIPGLKVNEVASAIIETEVPVVYDSYDVCPENARGIIIDPATHNTVAAIMIY